MNPYSDLKAAWHTDKIAALRDGRQIVPSQVQLILSDLCNQDCHFCAYRMSNGFSSENFVEVTAQGVNRNPNRMIPYEKAQEVLRDCQRLGVKAIQFTGGGEPTVHPQHMELFTLAQELGLETSLVTNGVLLRKDWEAVLPKMAWIRVSLDAGTPETYAAIRKARPSTFNSVLANVRLVADAIERSGSPCVLGVGFVVTRENFSEIEEAVGHAAAAGAHNVRMSAMFSRDFATYYAGVESWIEDRIARAVKLYPGVRVYNLFGDRISDLKQHAPDYDFCGYQQFNMYIGGDLKVYRCCNTSYTNHGQVGDLKNQSLMQWFHSEQKRQAYGSFNARSCDICQFNGKNRVISQLVDKEPVHVNFV